MGKPFRIALVLLASVAAVAAFHLLRPFAQADHNYVIRIELPPAGQVADLPEVSGPQDASRPLVVIDAGHGGHDPGASGPGVQEKALTLELALALRDRLLNEGGVRVALTRDEDRFLALEERAEIARALGADLFLSIHADSAGEIEGVTGASIYTLSATASSEAAARFAVRENSADVVNGVPLLNQDAEVNAILVELSQRRVQDQAANFASLIVREGEGAIAFHPQARRSASLLVLRAPDVPSVLFEAGFISNPEEAARLASPEGRRRFAEVMERAIRVYFARRSD